MFIIQLRIGFRHLHCNNFNIDRPISHVRCWLPTFQTRYQTCRKWELLLFVSFRQTIHLMMFTMKLLRNQVNLLVTLTLALFLFYLFFSAFNFNSQIIKKVCLFLLSGRRLLKGKQDACLPNPFHLNRHVRLQKKSVLSLFVVTFRTRSQCERGQNFPWWWFFGFCLPRFGCLHWGNVDFNDVFLCRLVLSLRGKRCHTEIACWVLFFKAQISANEGFCWLSLLDNRSVPLVVVTSKRKSSLIG